MLEILKNRFSDNMTRHPDVSWESVKTRLLENRQALEVPSVLTVKAENSFSVTVRPNLLPVAEACAMTMKHCKSVLKVPLPEVLFVRQRKWVLTC